MNQDIFKQFIEKLKRERSEAEVNHFLENLSKFSAAEVYFAMASQLTDEDMRTVENISDDKIAEGEIINRFKAKTGLTPQEFVDKLKEELAKGYPGNPV